MKKYFLETVLSLESRLRQRVRGYLPNTFWSIAVVAKRVKKKRQKFWQTAAYLINKPQIELEGKA